MSLFKSGEVGWGQINIQTGHAILSYKFKSGLKNNEMVQQASELDSGYLRRVFHCPAHTDNLYHRAGKLGRNNNVIGYPQYIDRIELGAYQRLGFDQEEAKSGMDISFTDTTGLGRFPVSEK